MSEESAQRPGVPFDGAWNVRSISAEASDAAIDPYTLLDDLRSRWKQGQRDPDLLLTLASLLWRLYEFQQAEEILHELRAHSRTDARQLRQVAHRYFEVGRFRQSAEVMEQAVGLLPQATAEWLTTWAWTLERDHQMARAREQALRAVRLDPSYGPAVRLLAHLDRREQQFELALQRIDQQLLQHPGSFDWGLHYERAAILDRLQRYDEAWNSLVLAKQILAANAQPHLQRSYFIRRRQQELAQSVTRHDLNRWQADQEALSASSTRLCFLTGFPRSGTTLLEQILGSHPEVVDTDESDILASQFLAPIVWDAADTTAALIEMRSWDAQQLETGREIFWQFTRNYLATEKSLNGRLLIEKNPLQTADMPLAFRLFPEARWLVALRDPRDVVLSYLFTMVPLHWTSAPAISAVEAARFYAATMMHLVWWRERLVEPPAIIQYEALIDNPAAEVEQLCRKLQLPFCSEMLDTQHRSERRAVRTPTYHDVTQPLYRRAVGRWQHYEAHLAECLPLLEPFVREWGAM